MLGEFVTGVILPLEEAVFAL